MELARDCLQKSQTKQITSRYFLNMSENLERLVMESCDKAPIETLTGITKRLRLIISRPALLLECLEFDPQEFYYFLEAAEDQAKTSHGITTDIPKYIIGKLGLHNDPLAELQHCDEMMGTGTGTATACDSNYLINDLSDQQNESLDKNLSIVSISTNDSCCTSTPKKDKAQLSGIGQLNVTQPNSNLASSTLTNTSSDSNIVDGSMNATPSEEDFKVSLDFHDFPRISKKLAVFCKTVLSPL
jgi:microtubule-associated serine/threonine kinase